MESWLPVVGFDGRYIVSNTGKVKSLARKDRINHFRPEKEIGLITKRGYRVCTLSNDVIKGQYLIHRLVMRAFVGIPPNGMEVCHNDGDPLNCNVNNLRYDSHANNNRDRITHNTIPRGETHFNCGLKEYQAIEIYKSKEHQKLLANKYSVSEFTIYAIRTNKTWIWLTSAL